MPSSSSSLYSTSSTSESSSTSSSSSLDSSSSSSSSSESSWGYSSSSSSSSHSNSSSSSIDSSSSSSTSSSSESSESIGNTSSSSSSSLKIWNQSKPLILANSAISTVSILNRLSQSIILYDTTYDIGKVYCYLYRSILRQSFNINLSLCTANNDGSPLTIISTVTIPSSVVDKDEWYSFDFNISGVTPSNRLLSFVMWQDGGDEDNYIMWGYGVDTTSTSAWLSEDNNVWICQEGIVRALKIVGVFNVFDLDNYDVNSPSALERELITPMNSNSSSYFNTQYLTIPSRVELDHPDVIISFVVDSSGSMGWNDRFSNRNSFISQMVNRFLDYYPSNMLFDIVKFGALVADAQSITANMGQIMSINLDINTPTRTTYIFTTSPSVFRVYKGDIYSHNGYTYTSFEYHNQTNTVVFMGNGVPLDVGILTKVSGGGDDTVNFDSYTKVTKEDSIVALGFRNLESGHVYNFGGISVDDLTLSGIETNLWHLLYPASESPSIQLGLNGPRNAESLDITASTGTAYETVLARSPFGTSFDYVDILSSVARGSNVVSVSNVTPYINDSRIDLVDKNYVASNLIVSSNSGGSLTFSPVSNFDIGNKIYEGGTVHNSSVLNAISFTGTTVQIYLRDVNVTRDITFFFQTFNGYMMEWDIRAHEEWFIHNLYWIGETALLPISVYDEDGVPFPNGTRIDLEVDSRSDIIEGTTSQSQILLENALIGQDTVKISSLEGFSIGQTVTLADIIDNIQIFTIEEMGSVTDEIYYIKFSSTILYNFLISDGASISPSEAPAIETANSPVNVSLSMVDVTPIFAQTTNVSSRAIYDSDPVPTTTTYDELNNAASYIQEGKFNIPTLNGNAVVRILPITEDVLKSEKEKSDATTSLLRMDTTEDFIGQSEQTTGDLESLGLTQEEPVTISDLDYSIETPVYLYSGEAESSMTTTAIELTSKTFEGLTIPGIDTSSIINIFVKQYAIYPSITMVSKTNVILSKQYFESFDVYFTPAYNIISERDDESQVVPFWIVQREEECGYFSGYDQTTLQGVYASQEDGSYIINYIVTNKFRLIPSGTLTIHLYSNKVKDLEAMAAESPTMSEYFLNVKYPDVVSSSNGSTITTPKLSDIDAWRNSVQNNPIGELVSNNTEVNVDIGLFEEMLEDYRTATGSVSADELSTDESIFYSNPGEWTNATQYETYETTIDIVNGRGSFTLPASTISSLVFVESTFSFSNQINEFEVIRGDMVVIANPITVGPLNPWFLYPKDNATDELASRIQWLDGSAEIDDGVQVELSSTTQLIPTVGETVNEWVNGLFIGPHDPYIYPIYGPNGEELLCPATHLEEIVRIRVDYLGYTTTVNRIIAWSGQPEEDLSNEFYFKVDGGNVGWADGSGSLSNITSDLSWAENILWIGENGIQRLLGYNQENGLRQKVKGFVGRRGEDLPLTPSEEQWSANGLVNFGVTPVNRNVGNGTEFTVYITTSYAGENTLMLGTGVTAFPSVPSVDGEIIIPRPKITLSDPLGISVELESYERLFIRDGIDSPNIVATVTWKGEPITNTFLMPNTTTPISYPFPLVTFAVGICFKGNSALVAPGDPPEPIDNRANISTCLEIKPYPDISLSSYVVQTGLFRTDIYDDSINIHTHACTVDNNGNGETTSTIVIEGTVATHSHIITNYISDTVLSHSHNLRCVAITQINPSINKGLEIFLNGYVVYDPTNCFAHDLGSNPEYFPILPVGNRIMFNGISIKGYEASQPFLEIEIETGRDLHLFPTEAKLIAATSEDLNPSNPVYFTAKTPLDTSRGFDVKAKVQFSEYVYEASNGYSITVPARTVNDGSRVTFEITPYKPSQEESQINIVAPDIIKKYMILKFRVSAAAEGRFFARDFYILVNGNLQWVSGIKSLMPELSNDSSYITTALTKIESLGGSQLHDAVKEATQRIIQEQTDNPSYKDYKKIIMIISDGDENSSEYSLQQAVNGIDFIDGTKETPSTSIMLGRVDTYSQIIMQKYAEKTDGEIYPVVNLNSVNIGNLIDYISETSNYGFNYGTFKNILDFEQASIPIEFRLGDVNIPEGTTINYRTRYTTDGEQWSAWSSWSNYNIATTFTDSIEKVMQFQYEVEFYGNGNFESPVLYGSSGIFGSESVGQVTTYNKPQSFTIFFKPISINTNDDEYLSSIHITHEATIPETSEIQYGLVQSGDLNIEEYLQEGKYINPDTYTILLTRYNEILQTFNHKTYYALNGRWPHSCSIEIYRFNSQNPNGIIVNMSDYSINSITGEINFFNYQSSSDTFTINVIFKPFFRLIAKITNYGQESATIHHIGVIYNTCKRIPKDSNGNIIHKSISSRLG